MGVQRPARILVVAVFAALLAGCAADPVPKQTPTPTFSTEAEAFAAAEATYRAYVDALNQVDLADPETFEAVYAWTTGEANEQAREDFSRMHAEREVVSGDSRIATFQPSRINEDGSVIADVCVDVSEVMVRDVNGVSVVAPDRVDVQTMRLVLVQARSETGLTISSIAGRVDGPTC